MNSLYPRESRASAWRGAGLLIFAAACTSGHAEIRGRADNLSYTTLCAEVDNVNIPVWAGGATSYRLVATTPRYYPTSINESTWDPEDCTFMSDRTLWLVGNKDGTNSEFQPCCSFTSTFYATDNPLAGIDDPASALPTEINNDWWNNQYIRFTADEVGDFNLEERIGALLTIAMCKVSGQIELKVHAMTTNGWLNLGSRTFTDANRVGTWNVPDLTWMPGVDTNVLWLDVVTVSEGGASTSNSWAYYDYLELKKRDEAGDNRSTPTILYDDGDTRVETVWIDFWWRYPRSTVVKVLGGGTDTNRGYLRIKRRMPGSSDYTEVFVLYEDGNARIIPYPPEGLGSVPYGASVILGPTTNCPRPAIGITEVVVDPVDLALDLTYESGGTAHVELRPHRDGHYVDVSQVTYDTDDHALARFRSMWVRDGKADVDRLQSERGAYPVLHGWTSATGSWWWLFKEVPTYHNTYSPDFRLELLGTNAGFFAREMEDFDSASGAVVAGGLGHAYGGSAVAMSPDGAEAVYSADLADPAPATSMRIRFADENGGDGIDHLGNTIRVVLDNTVTAETYSVNTGGTNEFELTPSLYLGDLSAGLHEIRVTTSTGTAGIVLDWFELVSQPVRPQASRSILTRQGESPWWGHPPSHLSAVARPNAVSGTAMHVEGSIEPWTTLGYFISNNIAKDYPHVFLRVRYSDDVGPNLVNVLVDDVPRARFGTEDTGGWSDYTNFHPIYLGPLTAGTVQLMFRITNANWGLDLDEFELYTVNWPPDINLPAYHTLPVGSVTSFAVTASDDNGDTVILSNTVAPAGATFAGGVFCWTGLPASVAGTTNPVVFVADDQQGLSNSVVTNAAWITVPYDWDVDGLGDEWEWTHFTNLQQDAWQDFDVDGSDNYTEQIAGTRPTDSNSVFRATGAANEPAGARAITISTEPGRRYSIFFADALADGPMWEPFAEAQWGVWVETAVVSSSHTFLDDESANTTLGAPADGSRFYRVRVGYP